MNKQTRREMFERWRAENPHPKTELNYTTPFELLPSYFPRRPPTKA